MGGVGRPQRSRQGCHSGRVQLESGETCNSHAEDSCCCCYFSLNLARVDMGCFVRPPFLPAVVQVGPLLGYCGEEERLEEVSPRWNLSSLAFGPNSLREQFERRNACDFHFGHSGAEEWGGSLVFSRGTVTAGRTTLPNVPRVRRGATRASWQTYRKIDSIRSAAEPAVLLCQQRRVAGSESPKSIISACASKTPVLSLQNLGAYTHQIDSVPEFQL